MDKATEKAIVRFLHAGEAYDFTPTTQATEEVISATMALLPLAGGFPGVRTRLVTFAAAAELRRDEALDAWGVVANQLVVELWASRDIGTVTDDASYLAPKDLAEKFKVKQATLEARLRRWRNNNPSSEEFVSNADRKSNQPEFLYQLSAVKPIIDGMTKS